MRAISDSASSVDIADMLKRPSRKAMTSGSLTTVPDKSVLIQKDLNPNGVPTRTQIFGSDQNPPSTEEIASRLHHSPKTVDVNKVTLSLRRTEFYMGFPGRQARRIRRRAGCRFLEHDPEKWEPVFRKDNAQTKR